MRINRICIDGYKNLNSFEAIFYSDKTVIIGQNASGKSNLLEAIVILFRNIESGKEPEFDFTIHYSIINKEIVIKGNKKGHNQSKYIIWDLQSDQSLFNDIETQIKQIFDGVIKKGNTSFASIRSQKDLYLPKHVFIYYSGLGNSNRIEELLRKPDKDFALSLVNNNNDEELGDRRFFYVRLYHSQLVLLSFYALEMEDDISDFLDHNLGIKDLDTITFVLKKPSWPPKKDGDPRFWGSKGVVRKFLSDLYEISTAPLRDEKPYKADLWHEPKENRLLLYISNINKIKELVKSKKWNNIEFFNILDSINISDLHRDIRIRIRKSHAENITFKDLSEGEQQLLTVLGLMRFTQYDESLYLLDEPDTHLNPFWRWKYMDFISKVAMKANTSQVIMTSHDPFTIGSLSKQEVIVFKSTPEGKTICFTPESDPKGMGTAGILTEIFELPTTLDVPTQEAVDERRALQSKLYYKQPMSDEEKSRLEELNIKLDKIGLSLVFKDPLYQKFEMEFAKEKEKKGLGLPETKEDVDKLNDLASRVLKKMFINKANKEDEVH